MAVSTAPPRPGAKFPPTVEAFDDARGDDGRPRPHYAPIGLEASPAAARRWERRRRALVDEHRRRGVGVTLDPVPVVVPAHEWAVLSAGLAQRARALDATCADVYGSRSAVAAGVLDEAALRRAEHRDVGLAGVTVPGGRWCHVLGFDVVRRGDGTFAVVSDLTRSPSGAVVAAANRAAVAARLAEPLGVRPVRPAEGFAGLLSTAFAETAPPGVSAPRVAIVADGPDAPLAYEHVRLADALDVPLVRPDELRLRAGRLAAVLDGGRGVHPIDVAYRRTDDAALLPGRRPSPFRNALVQAVRAGVATVANALGSGVAGDPAIFDAVPDLTRFLLGEAPLLDQVDRDAAAPAWLHPTVVDGQLRPAPITLRVLVVHGAQPVVWPGAVARVRTEPGAAGPPTTKDAWVLAA